MEIWWFSRVVAHHPYAILAAVFVFSTACLIVPLATNKFPDFSDPQLGFEARGTPVAQRLTAWYNLMKATGARGELTDNPLEYYNYLLQTAKLNSTEAFNGTRTIPGVLRKKPKKKNRKKNKKFGKNTTDIESVDEDQWDEIMKLKKNKSLTEQHDNHRHLDDSFFCNLPSSAYSRVIVGSDQEEENLWSRKGVLAQCHIDAALRANPEFSSLCETRSESGPKKHECCRSWSPANYVAFLANRTTCLQVTEKDLSEIEELLQRCSYYYPNPLTPDCAQDFNCQKQVPPECYAHNAPYHLLHYLVDTDFILPYNAVNRTNTTLLKSAMIILPIAASSATMNFYKDISSTSLTYGSFKVLGMELGLKSTLFDRLIVSDSFLLLFGFTFVTVCIWAYTSSVVLTISTIMAVVFSLGISYAVYTLVLKLTFFPFMNLLAVIVAVGIGADDAFIFCKVWEQDKQQKISDGGLTRLIQDTMKHAVPSMFVTSLTTAVAFFASIVSNVTAINCFSLFSGMTVIANFFLMVTWLPASVVISEHCRLTILSPANFFIRKIIRPLRILMERVSLTFSSYLSRIVINLRWLWLSTLGGIALASGMVVFSFPGLSLPDSPSFPLFDSAHLFEQYDLQYARRFAFEKSEMDAGLLPLRFVWGIKPEDNGDYLDPASRGDLVWDTSFDIANERSQVWLQKFCQNLRAQPFYHQTSGPLLSNCFIETFRNSMKQRCEDVVDSNISKAPCCEVSKYPYPPSVFRKCAAEVSASLDGTPMHLRMRGGVSGGIKYLKDSVKPSPQQLADNSTLSMPEPKIMALIVEYDSTFSFSLSFAEMDKFFNEVETWMQQQLESAPPGMKNGWFVSRLEFYELQRTLSEGTLWAMAVSMILALIVLALVTFNPLVSLYAIIAIGAAILVTVAALVLLGWRLNVLESVAVSTAIGLAVDFTLHYGVAYRASKAEKRTDRVKIALEQMGGPTLMAAITSGASGAFMLPSRVLAYIQIGIFLIIVMGVSWIYATFFLCPLLAVVGPSPDFAQFQYPSLRSILSRFRINGKDDNREGVREGKVDWRRAKGRGVLSESTLSTSSTVCQLHCTDLEALSTRINAAESMPPSPSSPLLHLEGTSHEDGLRENIFTGRRK